MRSGDEMSMLDVLKSNNQKLRAENARLNVDLNSQKNINQAQFNVCKSTLADSKKLWIDACDENDTLKNRINELENDLQFIERWANHHASHPNITAQESLSVIQHYPSIEEITKSYRDGVIPNTRNPYAEIESLKNRIKELEKEDEISDCTIKLCSTILAKIAITLKGEPMELARHGYHDLPELVAVLHLENELNKVQMEEMLTAMRRAVLALAFAAESSAAMRDDYNALSASIDKVVAANKGEKS